MSQLLEYHEQSLCPVLADARDTLKAQTQMIVKLLEVQVKYGLNVVNEEDEIAGKLFEPEQVCQLQARLGEALESNATKVTVAQLLQ